MLTLMYTDKSLPISYVILVHNNSQPNFQGIHTNPTSMHLIFFVHRPPKPPKLLISLGRLTKSIPTPKPSLPTPTLPTSKHNSRTFQPSLSPLIHPLCFPSCFYYPISWCSPFLFFQLQCHPMSSLQVLLLSPSAPPTTYPTCLPPPLPSILYDL